MRGVDNLFTKDIGRFDKGGGVVNRDDFRSMWREAKGIIFHSSKQDDTVDRRASGPLQDAIVDTSPLAFDAGAIFSKFDKDSDGRLDKREFEAMINAHPDVLRPSQFSQNTSKYEGSMPAEVITGRMLTHYDETAAVAIPSSAVEQHKAIGNRVLPLIESYHMRYERLRGLLTSRLFPRRESSSFLTVLC